MLHLSRCAIVIAIAGAAHAAGVRPMHGQAPPGRPRLAQSADTNDWTVYFDYGAAILRRQPNRADSAFYWASRLDPSRAEPLFARWVAFWLKDLRRFQDFLEESPRVLHSAVVLQADSFYLRALERNPFVPQNLRILPYDELPGRWREDLNTQAWLAYAEGNYQRAVDRFARLLALNPDKHVYTHFHRALAFVPLRLYDSAGAEMSALITTLRRQDTTGTTSAVYESKELVEYGIGLLAMVRRDNAGARAAFERALQENLAFVPAHAMLGDLALARRDAVAAASEYAQAVDLAPTDGWMRHRYGTALLNIGRPADAVAQFLRAIELEPSYADPYLGLGRALETVGDGSGAVRALDEYVRRAPRRATQHIENAQRRLAALRAGP
jgi:tetratricopeptide (TPR) repeat protein